MGNGTPIGANIWWPAVNGHMVTPLNRQTRLKYYLPATKNGDHVNSLTTLEVMCKVTASSVNI